MKLKMEAFFIQSVNQYRRILLYKTSYQRAKELHLISMRATGICSCASEVSEFSVSGHHCMPQMYLFYLYIWTGVHVKMLKRKLAYSFIEPELIIAKNLIFYFSDI